jgi:hypothetical protein
VRKRHKVDANQAGIVADLRRISGCSVLVLSAVGSGCPDILVGYRGFNLLFEIKNPGDSIRKDERGEAQRTFHAEWTGQARVVESFLEIINYMTGRYEEVREETTAEVAEVARLTV